MKEGWEFKKLKEIGRTQTGTTPSKSEKSFYGGDIPFVRPAELDIDGNGAIKYDSELKLTQEGALKSRIISANSILMCCIGSVGKTGYSIKEVTCNQQINTITPYDSCNGKFVYYALLAPSFQNEVIKIANSAKATLAIISKGKWEEMSIPVAPLSEQQQIVDRLDSAFAKIDAVKTNAEKQLNDAKALFQKELSKAMMPKEGWERKKLGEVTEVIHGKNQKDVLSETGKYPIYGSGGNIMGYASDYLCEAGTTILGRKGSINNPMYIEEKFWNVDTAFGIGPKGNNVSKFIYYFVLSIDWNEKNTGTTLPSLTQQVVKNVKLSVPPLSEQQAIVTHLDTLSEKLKAVEEKQRAIMAECDAMKQALLREVFE